MGIEISTLSSLIINNGYLFAVGGALCIIVATIGMMSPSILSNYNEQSILSRIKNDFRIKAKAVQDISEVKHLTEHVQEQTEIIKSSLNNRRELKNDVSKASMCN